jgi:GT2 family glycosyltransferase
MKKIGLVTVNYNTEEDTHAFLKSLEKVKTSNCLLDIIIIDNGSEKIFKLEKPANNITLIRSEKNTGFSGGFNIGIKKALNRGNEYIVIINNDTMPDPDFIENLTDALERSPKIGVVVPKIYFTKGHEFHKDKYKKEELGKILWFAGGSIDWDNVKSIHRGLDQVDHGQYNVFEKTDFATGCCLLVRREVLEKVGLFDERYFLYYEDADLNERIKRAGFLIYYVPDALLYHNNASSSGGAGKALHDYFLTRNQMLFGMRYAPFKSKIALIKQSLRFLLTGRPFQKRGIFDYYFKKFGKGTFFTKEEKI